MNNPSGMSLWKGGLGEPLPAEKWQEVADFHRSAVRDLLADHHHTFAGMPVHSGLRWARAAAILRVSALRVDTVDPTVTILAAVGFEQPPRAVIRDGARSHELDGVLGRTNDGPGRGLVLEWRLPARGGQLIMYGSRARGGAPVSPGYMQPYDHGDGRGELWVGAYSSGADESTPSAELLSVESVFLLIR